LPLDYIDSFSQRVESVTLEEVNDALKRRLTLEKTIRIIVGPEAEFLRTDG
jgi:predicted Zn-dependent peptidase